MRNQAVYRDVSGFVAFFATEKRRRYAAGENPVTRLKAAVKWLWFENPQARATCAIDSLLVLSRRLANAMRRVRIASPIVVP